MAIDLSSAAAAQKSAEDIKRALPASNGSLEITAEFDDKSERRRLRIARMHHGNPKVTVLDEDFLVSGDYKQIRETAQTLRGLLHEGAFVKRGERTQPVTQFQQAMTWLLAEVDKNIAKNRYKGPGRNEPRATVGNHHGPGDAAPAQGADRRRDHRRRNLLHPDGRRSRTQAAVHRKQCADRAEHRRLNAPPAVIDLYYWTTPNGHKITIFLEEAAVPYRIIPVNIGKGEQFDAGVSQDRAQ